MKVLLLRPPLARRSFTEVTLAEEPLASLVVGSVLRKRHEVRLVDMRMTPKLERELSDFEPDVAVVGVVPLVHGSLDRVLGELRDRFPGIRVLLIPDSEYGNEHVVLEPEEYFHPLADVLTTRSFLNDLVSVVPAVVNAWEDGSDPSSIGGLWIRGWGDEWTPTTAAPGVVGDYGVPDRGLLGSNRGRYSFGGIGDMAYVFTSYGCRHRCRYCTMSNWNGSIFERNHEDILNELQELTEQNVFLADFEPLQAPKHMARLADAIEEAGVRKNFYFMTRADSALKHLDLLRRWKEIGLRWVYLGLDGHSDERLEEMRKGSSADTNERALRELEAMGLSVVVGFVVRPDFTRQDFADLRAHVKRLAPPIFGFTVETPLVGTRLYDEQRERVTSRDWSLYDFQHALLPTSMPLSSFYRQMVRLHALSSRMSLRRVLRDFSLRDLMRSARMGIPRILAILFSAAHHEQGPSGPSPSKARADQVSTAFEASDSASSRVISSSPTSS